ncbi:uncharacterized protein LOC126984858 isoform X22 [Eriocheir sinensis]|uniref:uncharacterized protein LOC126984858 isoform X22 n=1 Tax=Eriocheir sinensis TaxID=95602 RepID=UPI0021C7D154|nr:uncharacterized protein LOC126984858 isoform X22 [Eriocheir sinensis]
MDPRPPVCGGKENKERTRTTATHSASAKKDKQDPDGDIIMRLEYGLLNSSSLELIERVKQFANLVLALMMLFARYNHWMVGDKFERLAPSLDMRRVEAKTEELQRCQEEKLALKAQLDALGLSLAKLDIAIKDTELRTMEVCLRESCLVTERGYQNHERVFCNHI